MSGLPGEAPDGTRPNVAPPSLDNLFPVDRTIPERLQIGRAEAIEQILERVIDGGNLLVIEARRVGKSSAIRNGALVHARDRFGAVTAVADLRAAGIDNPAALAHTLLVEATATGAGSPPGPEQADR